MTEIAQLPAEQQLDFWIGEWDVSWGEGQHGINHIQRILDGRVIQETFDGGPLMNLQCHSVSVYNPKIQQWQQTWVDNEGSYWHLEGGWQEDRFILMTDDLLDGLPIKLRMIFFNITRDRFEWNWEISKDNGQTWSLQWQIHYQRK